VAYDQRKTLVVAPTMVDPHSGGGNAYRRMPKGNLDPTGHYYFFVSNHGTDREDAFIVEIPCQKLSGGCTTAPTAPPVAVSITSPRPAAKVSGMVPVAASASGDADIARVQFQLDGKDVGPSLDKPPFSIDWDTSKSTSGQHSLTVIAFKDSGGAVTSRVVPVTVMTKDASPPPPPAPGPGRGGHAASGGGGFSLWLLSTLALFGLIQLQSRRRGRTRS
jgi:hypothetical protein